MALTRWWTLLCVCAVCVAVVYAKSYTVEINTALNRHAISEFVYGMNSYGISLTQAQLAALHVPVIRMGGNAMTRYNYVKDCSNSGADWYYEVGNCDAANKETSNANKYAQLAKDLGVPFVLDVPILGYVADKPNICSCSSAPAACSTGYDTQWRPQCGNCANSKVGATDQCAPDKAFLPVDSTHLKINGTWNGEWAAYLAAKFGASAPGSAGRRIYELDNEPALWVENHKDAHQTCVSYDELWTKMRDSAIAILRTDPLAEISTSPEWNYRDAMSSGCDQNPPAGKAKGYDKAAHNNMDLYPWLLKQFHDYEVSTGKRLIHYVALHHGTDEDNSVGVKRTRTFWDPNYVSTGWYQYVGVANILPRMRQWAAQNYPGTKTAITEYYKFTSDLDSSEELVSQAMLLGIFGREQLDLATLWDVPSMTQRMMGAHVLYRNYDGKGAKFLNISVSAASSNEDEVPAYAAVNDATSQLTVVLANALTAPATVTLNLKGFSAKAGSAQLYAGPTAGGSSSVALLQSIAVSAGQSSLAVTLPGSNAYLLVVGGSAVDPCASVSCGAHGSCSGGACTCKDGYTGATCNIPPGADPCGFIDCGAHGICNTGVCNCTGGYTGATCTIPPPTCFATATDAGSNNYWFAFNVVANAGHSIKAVAVVKDSSSTALSGPSSWGAAMPSVYTGSPKSQSAPPFVLQVTDTAGAVSYLSVNAFGTSYSTCQ